MGSSVTLWRKIKLLRTSLMAGRLLHDPSKNQRLGAGWSSPVARQAHNLKVVGSNPTPATKFKRAPRRGPFAFAVGQTQFSGPGSGLGDIIFPPLRRYGRERDPGGKVIPMAHRPAVPFWPECARGPGYRTPPSPTKVVRGHTGMGASDDPFGAAARRAPFSPSMMRKRDELCRAPFIRRRRSRRERLHRQQKADPKSHR